MGESRRAGGVLLDLTESSTDGFDLEFRAPINYLLHLRDELASNEFDGTHVVMLEFEDVHPVAARVDNYLNGTDYDSIGVTDVGVDYTRFKDLVGEETQLRVRCNRSQLRRFALLNRVQQEPPITFTAEVPAENATSFAEQIDEIEAKFRDSSTPD